MYILYFDLLLLMSQQLCDSYQCICVVFYSSKAIVPCKAMTFVKREQTVNVDTPLELWVGHGINIAILDPECLEILDYIQLGEDGQLNRAAESVVQLCCHGDQVWGFQRGSWDVFELDVETRQKVCLLDCSVGSEPNVMVAKMCNPCRNSATGSVHRSESVEQGNRSSNSDVRRRRRRQTQSLQRKLSIQHHHPIVQKVAKHRHVPFQARSLCASNGLLWVGRKCGDILVINVTKDNVHNVGYGQVLAVLCNGYHPGFSDGTVDHMVPVGSEYIAAIRKLQKQNGPKDFEERSEVVVWKTVTLEQLHRLWVYYRILDQLAKTR